MRPQFFTAAKILRKARESALQGRTEEAVKEYQRGINLLRTLPPEHARDVLLSHLYLAHYQTLVLEEKTREVALESLHLGVSYARSTRDPLARAVAEECMSGASVQL
ncbi:hypothetical protein [Deinococcus roseus]|uniref:Tetratricopeptide repeat protein n=1 Tax=Deinococcus roseus TaxID=392414 RepID=A0ABQ2D3Z4_9DEIO|nr:hypothetical protein [Deinococcus roseus]GGJ45381.1 hypothetical protein GCM10008938_34600 [Deinococcus roseus]